MAGRGRNATLPAWMTSGSVESVENQNAVASETKSTGQFADNEGAQRPTPVTSTPTAPSTGPAPQTNYSHLQPTPPVALGPPYSAPISMAPSHPPRAQIPQFQPPIMMPPMLPPMNFSNPSVPSTPPMLMPPNSPFPFMPIGGHMMGFPMPPRGPRPPTTSVLDPNNDVSAWSQHETGDGRKYWYNRITMSSTFEKPFCLKTPEERSIPPCQWKEYTAADGKKYYNNGTSSVWVMPEEFRVWSEKMEELERRRTAPPSSVPPVTSAAVQFSAPTSSAEVPSNPKLNEAKSNRMNRSTSSSAIAAEEKDAVPLPTYATREEALDAFNAVLNDKHISSSMKFKEVQDLCQDDVRWNALTTSGDRRQALAEYQTKKMKVEKEALKNKARRCRDAFLLMLAENIEIDVRTRWKDAVELLQSDSRFKNVEDVREREELFNDFVLELEKKEREDKLKERSRGVAVLEEILQTWAKKSEISRKSLWSDVKARITDTLCSVPELRVLEDSDARKCFQDIVEGLETAFRQQRKARKEELQSVVDAKVRAFKAALEKMCLDGLITCDSRWKEFSVSPALLDNSCYKDLVHAIESSGNDEFGAEALGVQGNARDVFEKVVGTMRECLRADKRLILDALDDAKVLISHDTDLASIRDVLFKSAGLKENAGSLDSTSSTIHLLTEDGEEIDDFIGSPFDMVPRGVATSSGLGRGNSALQIRNMLIRRPFVVSLIFSDLHNEALAEYEEEIGRKIRREERFNSLLEEYFYRSDHVGLSWDEAKLSLDRHSAYSALNKSDRKRLFSVYMEELGRKLEEKTKSMKSLNAESDSAAASPELSSATLPLPKSPSGAAGGGSRSVHSDESSDSDNGSDTKSKKSSKKQKKEKKHKKHKHSHRSREDDGSDESESESRSRRRRKHSRS